MVRFSSLLIFSSLLSACSDTYPVQSKNAEPLSLSINAKADPLARLQHDLETLVDPSTRLLPVGILEKALFNMDIIPSGTYYLSITGEETEIVVPFVKTR